MDPPDGVDSDLVRSAALHGRPTVVELLGAAREFLATEVLGATEGSVQFHVRVTVRILDTVTRELLLGPGQADRHAALLAHLGYDSDDDLAGSIRSGSHDGRIAELARALEPVTRAKVEVANPSYLREPATSTQPG